MKETYTYTTGTLGTVQSTVNYGYGNSNWKDQLTSYNGTSITYDLSGNPLNWRNASSMNWTGRQLDSMTLTDGTTLSFLYNSDGLRVSKTVGGDTVKYRWNGTTLLAEEHSNYTITFLYDGDTLIGFNYGGNNYFYGIDNLGVIHYVYNEAGTVVVTYTYDAWGNTISTDGDDTIINVNPIRYKSYYYDSETGLFYLQSRYYDAVVGRFVSADDVECLGLIGTILSYNLYAYCENNSVNNFDDDGSFYIPRGTVAFVIDALLLLIPAVGFVFAPVKAAAKAAGKVAGKKLLNTLSSKLPKVMAKLTGSAQKIMKYVKLGVSKIPKLGKKLAKAISWENIFGGANSAFVNTLLKSILPNIDIVLSVGGFVAGLLDAGTDGQLDGRITFS